MAIPGEMFFFSGDFVYRVNRAVFFLVFFKPWALPPGPFQGYIFYSRLSSGLATPRIRD